MTFYGSMWAGGHFKDDHGLYYSDLEFGACTWLTNSNIEEVRLSIFTQGRVEIMMTPKFYRLVER